MKTAILVVTADILPLSYLKIPLREYQDYDVSPTIIGGGKRYTLRTFYKREDIFWEIVERATDKISIGAPISWFQSQYIQQHFGFKIEAIEE